MAKPTEAQTKILGMMVDGSRLVLRGSSGRMTVLCKNGKPKLIRANAGYAVIRRGWIEIDRSDWALTWYQITDAGREALNDHSR